MYGNKKTLKAGQIVDKVFKKVRNLAQVQEKASEWGEWMIMDDREGSESHLYITPGWEISATIQNCSWQEKVRKKKKSPVTVVFSFPHSLCFPSPSYSPPATLLHTHSSHASTFLLLSFFHLSVSPSPLMSPHLLQPSFSAQHLFLGENRTRPGMLLLAWVVSRRIKNRWTPMLYSCVKLVEREGS